MGVLKFSIEMEAYVYMIFFSVITTALGIFYPYALSEITQILYKVCPAKSLDGIYLSSAYQEHKRTWNWCFRTNQRSVISASEVCSLVAPSACPTRNFLEIFNHTICWSRFRQVIHVNTVTRNLFQVNF